MAWNNLISGKKEQARILYEKALNLQPNQKVALINLAKIYYHLGENEVSRFYFEKALTLDLSPTEVKEINKLLKKISTL